MNEYTETGTAVETLWRLHKWTDIYLEKQNKRHNILHDIRNEAIDMF